MQAVGLTAQDAALEEEIKNWYNGYCFASQVIYNPWSIINCVKWNGSLKAYWANTSGSDLLRKFIAPAEAKFKQDLERLIQGESIEALIDPTLIFQTLGRSSTTLWSLIFFSGYLTATAAQYLGREYRCTLTLPNRELHYEFDYIITSWFAESANEAYQKL